ncbi:hypothetical protein OZD66_03645 [Wolbachia endosymbiont of Drosophila baimaii]|nr:hypothetical protein [Wolbachia endosymbiont of Drosophila baimaii]
MNWAGRCHSSAPVMSSQCLTLLSFVIPVPRHWDPVFHIISSKTLYFNVKHLFLCLPT